MPMLEVRNFSLDITGYFYHKFKLAGFDPEAFKVELEWAKDDALGLH